jgi:hypothetical protein
LRIPAPVSACGYGVAGVVCELCTSLWAGRSEVSARRPHMEQAGPAADYGLWGAPVASACRCSPMSMKGAQ